MYICTVLCIYLYMHTYIHATYMCAYIDIHTCSGSCPAFTVINPDWTESLSSCLSVWTT